MWDAGIELTFWRGLIAGLIAGIVIGAPLGVLGTLYVLTKLGDEQ